MNVSCEIIAGSMAPVAKLSVKVDWPANNFRWLWQVARGCSSARYDRTRPLQNERNHRKQHKAAHGPVQA